VNSFTNARAVEEIHYGLYTKALEAYGAARDLEATRIWVCSVCGNTVTGEEPSDRCAVCGAAKERFVEIG
jgi:rubrerythrin